MDGEWYLISIADIREIIVEVSKVPEGDIHYLSRQRFGASANYKLGV